MSDRPPSQRTKLTAKSGEHPAVRTYRAKLDSITEKAGEATSKLDKTLEEFLADLGTPVRGGQ